MSKRLPESFATLASFTDKWVVSTEAERHLARLTAGMDELRSLYDAMLPRMEAIIEYLNGFDLKKLSEENRNLLILSFSFIEVSTSIEFFKSPTVPDGFDFRRFKVWK
ncbi:MAG: hypothetical protein V4500_00285 [Pseudomonadota bacterium]